MIAPAPTSSTGRAPRMLATIRGDTVRRRQPRGVALDSALLYELRIAVTVCYVS
jgi:hypothetical protein